ncbi:MAG: beta-porphyranase B [Rikenellaceae bacterium]
MMTKTQSIALLLMASAMQCCTTAPTPYEEAIQHIVNLPAAPEGYKWVVNEDFTDEFNGTELNTDLWHAKSPYWTNGRPPATFKAESVSVKDGYLNITNYTLDSPEGNDGKPGDKYLYAGGAVASKSQDAFYGYYETRMKASMTSMSSTFWLNNYGKIITETTPDGVEAKIRVSQELDIIETMGVITTLAKGDKSWNRNWNKQMNSNIHFWRRSSDIPTEDIVGKRVDIESEEIEPSGEDFHTYGCWWIDANTVKFYYDGKYMFTIKPSTKYTDEPMTTPMFMHLVTETYDWESGTTPEMLADKDAATTLYDWVRSYKLVEE